MGSAHPPRPHEREGIAPPRHGDEHDDGYDYISALLEENAKLNRHDCISALLAQNAQLRGLVVHLSVLVLKNVIDKK
jgi:hypothetical protein